MKSKENRQIKVTQHAMKAYGEMEAWVQALHDDER
jgi:hypothetical protein